MSQQWSGATPCIALFCHSDLSRTWFVAPTWETAKSNSRADCQAFVNSCLQLSEQDLQSQLRTVSNATKVSAVIYNHNNNLPLQAECLKDLKQADSEHFSPSVGEVAVQPAWWGAQALEINHARNILLLPVSHTPRERWITQLQTTVVRVKGGASDTQRAIWQFTRPEGRRHREKSTNRYILSWQMKKHCSFEIPQAETFYLNNLSSCLSYGTEHPTAESGSMLKCCSSFSLTTSSCLLIWAWAGNFHYSTAALAHSLIWGTYLRSWAEKWYSLLFSTWDTFVFCKLWHDLLLHNYKIVQQHSKWESGLTPNTLNSILIKTFSNQAFQAQFIWPNISLHSN